MKDKTYVWTHPCRHLRPSVTADDTCRRVRKKLE